MRVIIVRALPGIGDWLCAVPALARVKRVDPQAHVTLVGLASTAGLIERYAELVDEFVPFPGFPGIPEVQPSAQALTEVLERHRGSHDICMQLHGSGPSINEFCLLLGSNRTAMTSLAVTSAIDFGGVALVPFTRVHESDRLMAVVNTALGVEPERARFPWFSTNSADHGQADAALRRVGAHRPYVAIHPGASRFKGRWSTGGFAAVASECVRRGFWVVLTGNQTERDLVHSVCLQAGPGVCSVAGSLDLGGTAAVIQGASFVVSNDTGIAHLSAAMGVPLVVVYVSSNPLRWAPRGPAIIEQVVRSERTVSTRDRFPTESLTEPTPDDVMSAIDRLGPLSASHADGETRCLLGMYELTEQVEVRARFRAPAGACRR